MKIRQGFVSNSSSSSFIIAYKKESPKCSYCGRSDPNIIEIIKNSYNGSDETEVRVEGKKEVIQYIKENWYAGTEIIKDIEKTNDMEIALISISYHSSIQELLKNCKYVKIIYKGN